MSFLINPYRYAVASEEFCNNLYDDDQSLSGTTGSKRAGQQWNTGSDLINKTLATVKVPLRYDVELADDSDELYARVYASDNSLKATVGTIQNSALSTSWATITFSGGTPTLIESGDYVVIEISSEIEASEQITRHRYYYTSNPFTNTSFSYYRDDAWTSNSGHCMTYCVET